MSAAHAINKWAKIGTILHESVQVNIVSIFEGVLMMILNINNGTSIKMTSSAFNLHVNDSKTRKSRKFEIFKGISKSFFNSRPMNQDLCQHWGHQNVRQDVRFTFVWTKMTFNESFIFRKFIIWPTTDSSLSIYIFYDVKL